MLARLDELLDRTPPPTKKDLNEAFWQACHGGQRRAAGRLLAAGADITASPDRAKSQTALDAAIRPDARCCDLLAGWLRRRGATSTDKE